MSSESQTYGFGRFLLNSVQNLFCIVCLAYPLSCMEKACEPRFLDTTRLFVLDARACHCERRLWYPSFPLCDVTFRIYNAVRRMHSFLKTILGFR